MYELVVERLQDLMLLQIYIEEVRLNPVDIKMLREEVKERPGTAIRPAVDFSLGSIMGIRVVEDESVQVGKIHVVKGITPPGTVTIEQLQEEDNDAI